MSDCRATLSLRGKWNAWFQTWILLWKLKSSLRPDFSQECRFENWNHPWSFQFQTYVLMLFQTFKLARLVWWYLLAILLAELNAVPKAKIIPGHSHFRLECYSESWNRPLVILISDLNVNLKLGKTPFSYMGYAALQFWILAGFLLTTCAFVY